MPPWLTPAHPAVEEVASMSPMFCHCDDCGGERLFGQLHEAPGSCPDSPGGLCPEWACTECGAALLASFPLPAAELGPGPGVTGRVA
jgi:hypothetical protein